MKFHKNEKLKLNDVIKTIVNNPTIGEEKRGDLKGIYFYKFKIENNLYLLSYRMREGRIEFITFGPHEKYYKNMFTDLNAENQIDQD
jgi:hypothetical protein